MSFKLHTHLFASLFAMALLAGCGQEIAASTGGAGVAALRGQGFEKFPAQAPRGAKLDGRLGLLSTVDLSAEQQAQLKAIAAKYKPARPEPTREKPGVKLKDLLTGDPLDAEALKSALAEAPQPVEPGVKNLGFLKEARAVLTEAQREALVEKLESQPTDAPPAHPERPQPTAEQKQLMLDRLAAKLGLDESQKAAYAAFQAKLEASRPAPTPRPDVAAHRDAMITFIETGDTTALEALQPAPAARPAFPADEFVALAQSLTVDQRKQLLSHVFGGPRHHAAH